MENATLLRSKYERLERVLSEAVGHFRCGRDNMGLDAFLDSIDDMDDIVLTCLYLEEYQQIGVFLPSVRMLQAAVQNEDIVAMIDILEFMLLPLAGKALEGTDQA